MGGLEIEMSLDRETEKFLNDIEDNFRDGLEEGMKDAAFMIEASAKKGMGKQGRPKVRTGHLRRSIKSGIKKRPRFVTAWVGSRLVYARPLEKGSVQHIRGFRRVKIRGVGWRTLTGILRIKPYPWLRPAFEDERAKVTRHIMRKIQRGLTR